MNEEGADPLVEQLREWIGQSLSASGPAIAPDQVNLPMIRHWVDALDDRNPIYLDPEAAAETRFGEVVAPPAMLQTWTWPRVRIEGIAERGGAPDEIAEDNPIRVLDTAGYVGTLATNSELSFERYLTLGDRLQSDVVLESVSERKTTSLGKGYFVTWVTTYTDQNRDVVGRQLFRIFKFDPATIDPARLGASSS